VADEKLGRAVLEITVDDKQYKFAMEGVRQEADKTKEHLSGLNTVVNAAAIEHWGSEAISVLKEVVVGVVELGERGTRVDEVAEGFHQMSEAAGSTAQVMLGAMREGVRGTVSDFDLMQVGTKMLSYGLKTSEADMRTLAEGAKMLAERTGGNAKEAFETLTNSIATGRTTHLKQLGLMVDGKAAAQAYADAHGLDAKALTAHEKAAATAAAVTSVLHKQLGTGHDQAVRFGDRVEQAKAAMQNFTDALGVGISRSPVLMAGMNSAATAIQKAFGGAQTTLIDLLVHALEKVVIVATYVAQAAVFGAGQFVLAWAGANFAFNAFIAGMVLGVATAMDGLVKLGEVAAKLGPTISGVHKEDVAAMKELATSTRELAGGFTAQGQAALKSGQEQLGVLAKVNGVIVTTRKAMVDAQGAQTHATEGTKRAIIDLGGADEEISKKRIKNAKQIAETLLKLQQQVALDGKVGMAKRLQEIENEKNMELLKARELTGGKGNEYAKMVAAINQHYVAQVRIARTSTDAIMQLEFNLQRQITGNALAGQAKRLADLKASEDLELRNLLAMTQGETAEYTRLAALIKQKYDGMRQDATNSYKGRERAAEQAGFKEQSELATTADNARQLYDAMRTSQLYTTKELEDAWVAAEKAKREATGKATLGMTDSMERWGDATVSILGSLGGKHKSAAIAGALISTYMAVAKTMASIPWPASLPAVAAALAAGMANVNKIRSQPAGFKEGTPGLDFVNFGSESATLLHGPEAVIPQGKGHVLAGEIAGAMGGRGLSGDQALGKLDKLIQAMERLPYTMKRAMRDGLLQTQ